MYVCRSVSSTKKIVQFLLLFHMDTGGGEHIINVDLRKSDRHNSLINNK